MQTGGEKAYRFEGFTLDLKRGSLSRADQEIELRPKSFEMLRHLVENAGRLVQKNELAELIWPAVAVTDESVTRCISDIRLALCDSARRLIRTVPRRGYRFAAAVSQSPSRTESRDDEQSRGVTDKQVSAQSPAPLPPDKPSIAVLPFQNLSQDPEQEYFADGITEDVITALSRYSSLFVISRGSCFTYKHRAVDVKQIGRELGVRYVLEGTLRKSADQIRVTAQLAECESGKQVWADRHDRELADLFAIQDDITAAVTVAIAPAIADAERRRALRRPPDSLDAWAAYQRGLWHLAIFSADDGRAAQKFFRRAIDFDPNFAGAYAGLALTHLDFGSIWGSQSLAKAQDEAEQCTRRGIAVDSADAQVHSVLAITLYMRGDHDAAIAEARSALALSPNLAEAHGVLGQTLIFSGRPGEGLDSLATCIRLDPRSPRLGVRLSHTAIGHYLCGEYDVAASIAARAVRSYPDYPISYHWLAASLGQLGKAEKANEALQTATTFGPSFEVWVRQRAPWMRTEDHEHLLVGLQKAGWES